MFYVSFVILMLGPTPYPDMKQDLIIPFSFYVVPASLDMISTEYFLHYGGIEGNGLFRGKKFQMYAITSAVTISFTLLDRYLYSHPGWRRQLAIGMRIGHGIVRFVQSLRNFKYGRELQVAHPQDVR